MQPHAARGIGSGKLVAGEIFNAYRKGEYAAGNLRWADRDARGLRLEERGDVGGGGRKVRGLRDDGEVITMRAEHALHEEVGTDEGVESDVFARLAQEGCNDDGLADRGHVALLAGALISVVAVQPLEVGHLLGKTADWFAVRAEGSGVKRVATTAECRVMNMSSLHEAVAGRHHVHLGDVIGIRSVWAVEWSRIGSGRGDDEVAAKRCGRAQASRFNLMAHCAGDAIGGGRVLRVIAAEGQSRE